jgi:hypothetical protein
MTKKPHTHQGADQLRERHPFSTSCRQLATLGLAICLAGASQARAIEACVGDCNTSGEVTVSELVTGVSIALGETSLSKCGAFDDNQDGEVTVNELVLAVGNALVGCPKPGTLLRGIQFVPDTIESGPDLRTRLLRAGSDLVFTDGTDFPIKVLSLETGRTRPLVRRMSVPVDLAVVGDSIIWTEAQSGFGKSGCVGAGVLRVVNETTLGPDGHTRTLAREDNCAGAVGELIVHGDAVYWLSSRVSPNEYSIERTLRSTGRSETLYTTGQTVIGLGADTENLYWREGFIGPGPKGALKKMAFSGGEPSTVAEDLGTDGSSVGPFAVHAGYAILSETGVYPAYQLVAVPLDGEATRILATLPARARSIVGVGEDVYWVDESALRSVPLAGGEVTTLLQSLESPVDLAAMNDTLIWTESVCCAHGRKGRVRRLDIGGEVVTLAEGLDDPGAIAAGDGLLYWVEGGPIGEIEGFGRIAAVPVQGGSISDLAAGCSTTLPIVATDGTAVYYVDRFRVEKVPLEGGTPVSVGAADFYIMGMATDGERVYWSEDPVATVRSVPVSGGDATTLGMGSGPAGSIAVFGNSVYSADAFVRILRVPTTGGATEVFASDIAFLSDMTVDSSGVYFSEQDSGMIRHVPLQGGPVPTVGGGMPLSWNILAVDPGNVYWVEQVNLSRVSKAGGSQTIVATGLDSDVSVANGVVSDGTFVYWTEVAGGTIRRASVD